MAQMDAYALPATRLLYEVFQANPRVRDWATVVKALNARACAYTATASVDGSSGEPGNSTKWSSCHPAAGGAAANSSGAVTVQQPVIYIVNGEGTGENSSEGIAQGQDVGNGVRVFSGTNTTTGSGNAMGVGIPDGMTGAVTAQMPAIYIVNNGGSGSGSGSGSGKSSDDAMEGDAAGNSTLIYLLYTSDFLLTTLLMESKRRMELETYNRAVEGAYAAFSRDETDTKAARRWFEEIKHAFAIYKTSPDVSVGPDASRIHTLSTIGSGASAASSARNSLEPLLDLMNQIPALTYTRV
jgi:hypothetical protein